MRNFKVMTAVTMFLLLCLNFGQAVYAQGINTRQQTFQNITVNDLKKQVDLKNYEVNDIYNNVYITSNGVKIFSYEDIVNLDSHNKNIVMMQELMRRKLGEDLSKFRMVTFPLISETEQYGIMGGYTDTLYTDEFFEDGENDEYKDTKIPYDYFKQINKNTYVEYIEALDFINLENTQIVFSPYKILSSYAYCEDYSPEGANIRRTRVYYNPVDGEDIVSTLYHELGHMVYFELVRDDEENYKKYYDIYKEEFVANDASNNYGYWDKKLTENFAEDFKIYVTKKVMKNNESLKPFIIENEKSFLSKNTIYPVKTITDKYFDEILKEYIVSTNKLKPNVELQLNDYQKPFVIRDESYLNQYVNKIVTNSNKLTINFKGNNTQLIPTSYTIRNIDKLTYETKAEKELTIKKDVKTVNIKTPSTDIYEIKIRLQSINNDYSETITYFIIKH